MNTKEREVDVIKIRDLTEHFLKRSAQLDPSQPIAIKLEAVTKSLIGLEIQYCVDEFKEREAEKFLDIQRAQMQGLLEVQDES